MTPILIAVHGVKRSGKNSVASLIEKWAGRLSPSMTVKQRGFADKVKLAFARQFFPDITLEEAIEWCDKFKETGKGNISWISDVPYEERAIRSLCNHGFHGRDLIAQFATEGARDIYGEDHWVDMLLPTSTIINEYDLPEGARWWWEFPDPDPSVDKFADIAVISDVRFENEFVRVKALGGINIKVRRTEAEEAVIEHAKRQGREVHLGERGLPDEWFDYVLHNNSSLGDLEVKVCEVMEEITHAKATI